MAPQTNLGPRMKRVQVTRPFVYGSTAKPFDPVTNPKPEGVPADHTHSWEVFIRGIKDTDITYWLRRVQFKLHESIPNHVRMIEGEPGKPFSVKETGWGEFEITMKLYYVTESGEKPQTLYHHLRLHPYGRTDEEKAASRGPAGEIVSWAYEELLFNEPYEKFYKILTEGAHPVGHPLPPPQGGGKGKGKGAAKPPPPLPGRDDDAVWERTALIALHNRPGEPFSRELEALELKRLQDAHAKVQDLLAATTEGIKEREDGLRRLKEDNAKAGGT